MSKTTKNKISVYKGCLDEAFSKGEKPLFVESQNLNSECGRAIDDAIRENTVYGEMAGTSYIDTEKAIKSIVAEYGMERVAWVLAGNVQAADFDGRISKTNKDWAKDNDIPENSVYHLNMHRTILDSLISKFRKIEMNEKENMVEDTKMEKEFSTPLKTETTQNVENYLTGKMSFDKSIVKSCIEKGSIYQTEVFSEKLSKNLPCAVFVGYDEKGVIQSAVIKGFGGYEQIEAGSQLKYAFMLLANEKNGKTATAVSIFESPIELLAGATIAKLRDKASYSTIHRLAANQSIAAVRTFLENNPQVKTVNLCLANTDKGHKFAEKINNMFENLTEQRGESVKVNNLIPKNARGYQEMLQNKVGQISVARKENQIRE